MGFDTLVNNMKTGNCRISFSDILNALLKEKEHISIFQNMSDDEIKELVSDLILTRFMPNELVFSQGEENNDYIYYILDGLVIVMDKSEGGMLSKVAKLGKNMLLGEMKHLCQNKRTATCMVGSKGMIAIRFMLNENVEYTSLSYKKFYANIIKSLEEKFKMNHIDFLECPFDDLIEMDGSVLRELAIENAKKLEEHNKLEF
jgi:predicted CopG family antitoxin